MRSPSTLLSKSARRAIARWARTISAPFGRATAPLRMTPNYLIVGAQRAGTTSLYNYLIQHPEVGRVRLGKGVHYFDTNATKSMGWYRSHFPIAPKWIPFRSGSRVVGEGSPYYMFHPTTLERIDAALPGVKVIAILRDPIERAHSQWAHESARGFETLEFEDALRAEDDRLAGEAERLAADPAAYSHAHQHQSYVARGQYAEQVERLWRVFGRDRVLVIAAPRLFGDPHAVYSETLSFLGLPPHTATYEVHNARSYSKIAPATEALLAERFAESNTRLVELLGDDFDFRRRA